jgi:acyl-CoA synthetase (AMP-forming)/AMP-acid ligase II
LRGAWVYTGDVGYIDDDDFLFVVDRVKDMVVTDGKNVSFVGSRSSNILLCNLAIQLA